MLKTKNYRDFQVVTLGQPTKSFAGAKLANKCLPNDEVDATETGCVLKQRTQHPVLAGLVELNSKVRYGFTSRNIPIYLFTPFNEAYPPFIVGCSERDSTRNRIGLITFDSWTETYPRGNLQRLLPEGADEEALFWTHTPYACVKWKGDLPSPPPLTNRVALPKTTFNIDPPGCRDVDDVISIEWLQDPRITITIADVAATVPQGHPLDGRAAQIGQTFYQDGNQPKHMFPAELSEDALSLLPGKSKAGLSLSFTLGDPTNVTWFESIVVTEKSYSYESIYEEPTLCTTLTQMCTALNEPTQDSHKWIEVAMKFYNKEAAKVLRKAASGLLRSHKAPDMEKLKRYTAVDPSLEFLAYSAASYVPADEPNPAHWSLGADLYTHASSPIRRYADLVNQRVIKAFLHAQPLPLPTEPTPLNKIAKAAKQHDRDLVFVRALANASTGSTEATIIDIQYIDDLTKISLHVPAWSLIVKIKSKTAGKNTIVSRDETATKTIELGQKVTLSYYSDMTARNWKRRMVLSLF